MIAFGKLFIQILIDIQLTLEEYFVLYCFAYDKKPLIKMYSNNVNPISLKILNNLKDRGFLKETEDKKWLITSKGTKFIKDMVDSYEDAEHATRRAVQLRYQRNRIARLNWPDGIAGYSGLRTVRCSPFASSGRTQPATRRPFNDTIQPDQPGAGNDPVGQGFCQGFIPGQSR